MRQKEMCENPENKESKRGPIQGLSEDFKRLAERSRDAIYHYDLLSGKVVFGSKIFFELYGSEKDAVVITSKDIILHVHPEDREKVKKAARDSLAPDLEGGEAEYRFIRDDGSIRWMHDRWNVIRDSSGRALAIEGSCRDDTERKQVEVTLKNSEEKYRTLLDSIEEAYFEIDVAGNFTFFNDSLSEMLGYTKEELVGMNNRHYLTPESYKKMHELSKQIYRTGNPIKKVDCEIIRKDGESGFHEVSASMLRDEEGRIVGFRGIVRDITNRKRAEEVLRRAHSELEIRVRERTEDLEKANEKLQVEITERRRAEEELLREKNFSDTVINSLPGLFYLFDAEGNLRRWNKNIEEVSGYSSEEIGRMTPLDFFVADEKDYIAGRIQNVFTEGKAEAEGNFETKTGRKIPYFFNGIRMVTDDNIYVIGAAIDITERKRAEEELKKYRESLEHMVEERTRELKEVQKELVEKAVEAGRAQLSAMVLHNIGNAMTPVRVHVEGMKSKELDQIAGYLDKSYMDLCAHIGDLQRYVNDDPRGKEVFSFMEKLVDSLKNHTDQTRKTVGDIDRAVSYISDILTLQQSYAARELETKERVDLNRVLEDAVRMQAGALEKRGIVVKKDLASRLPNLLVDKGRLIQVVVNLIKNSYEAIDQVADQNQEQRIIFKSFHDGGHVGFEITDTGEGIAPAELASICEFGYSLKGSSGFGLYYCKSFVEANNGTLTVSSPGKGKGATISVVFPTMDRR